MQRFRFNHKVKFNHFPNIANNFKFKQSSSATSGIKGFKIATKPKLSIISRLTHFGNCSTNDSNITLVPILDTSTSTASLISDKLFFVLHSTSVSSSSQRLVNSDSVGVPTISSSESVKSSVELFFFSSFNIMTGSLSISAKLYVLALVHLWFVKFFHFVFQHTLNHYAFFLCDCLKIYNTLLTMLLHFSILHFFRNQSSIIVTTIFTKTKDNI
ncbi:hypothetical protein AGLY_008300 [Aphis glycines]|uniref:Uncharacterized protein n=1 Tax=Aphis glycines TaxID=307491 RepID=A0A6G0TLM5_APHGL|nr:hypothetical protein AGLY_008300 [Aphis glycines]